MFYQECMKLLERDDMASLYAECKRLEYDDARLIEIEKVMGLGQEDLIKQQCVRPLFCSTGFLY
jgi:hypothetical protein